MKKYALGIDFGTLSARAVLANLADGSIAATAAFDYSHGVMDKYLPSGKPLGQGWALQNPRDYLLALQKIVPDVMRQAQAAGDEVAALGVDFTCSTTLPTLSDGTPLCALPDFSNEPNAYVKLWKHHAESQAEHTLAVAKKLQLDWLKNSGGRVSSEWAVPKLLQILEEAPALFAATDVYLEAGDWVVWQLTGRLTRSASYACYKNFYREGRYPSDAFYAAVHPAFAGLPSGRMRGPVVPLSGPAGTLTAAMAAALDLSPGIPVAPGMTDAHTGVLSAKACQSGDMLSILGTSACHVLQQKRDADITGIAAKVREGILPGLTSYEANQPMGETFAWFIENACPAACAREAETRGISLHQLMNEKAAALRPGNGLIALDWFNGNRCILGDSQLSGMILGLTLRTPPEAIYRALLESAAYGMRTIVENYEAQGLPVRRIVALGGVSQKSPLLMQIISDVLGRELQVSSAKEGTALGAAITAAAAGGAFPSMEAAIAAMGQPVATVYHPGKNQAAYEKLYREYQTLHDYFGRGGNAVMRRLRQDQA